MKVCELETRFLISIYGIYFHFFCCCCLHTFCVTLKLKLDFCNNRNLLFKKESICETEEMTEVKGNLGKESYVGDCDERNS